MANPLACAIAVESLRLLREQPMEERVALLEKRMKEGLAAAGEFPNVVDVRVLGSIGVIEMNRPVDVGVFQQKCVERGVWIRPFGTRVYIMPPYVISDSQLDKLMHEMVNLVKDL